MNLLFHHVPRTGGSVFRELLIDWHKLPVELCYSDEHLTRLTRLYASGARPQIVFGHRARDIAGVAKAFDPGMWEVAAFRNPDEIIASDYRLAQANPDHVHHEAAMRLSLKDWAALCLRANPILSTIGHRRPDQWLPFHDIIDTYHQICRILDVPVSPIVLRDRLIQTPPMGGDLGLRDLNAADKEFLTSIKVQLPQ